MNTNKLSDADIMTRVRADVASRRNALNGKYKAGKFGLEFWDDDYVTEPPEIVKMRADLADKVIAKADSLGQDTNDLNILRGLGEEVKSIIGKPIPKSEALMTAIMVAIQLIVYYGIATGIWGLVFKKSFLWFSCFGAAAGFLISLLSAPVVAMQRTKKRIKNIVFGVSVIWGNVAIVIGILGLIIWIMELIFFRK